MKPLFPLANPRQVTRRTFIAGSASLTAAALLSSRVAGAIGRKSLSDYPFKLGIASGDPVHDGFVLWTRLAPRPLETGGGMPAEPVKVDWQVATDERMTRVVRSGTAVADPAWAHSVHVEVEGLEPARWYWYRFRAGGETSPVGRTRTMPRPDTLPDRFRFAFASCQKYEMGYYTAFEHMAREDLDLVVHLGDYIYEKADANDAVRPHGLPQAVTLDQYRSRYAVYKTDPALQAMHALVPWIVTWDDHEVNNDYAGDVPEDPEVQAHDAFLLRRAAGYQAYYEHMPLRRSALPSGPDMLLYRRIPCGRLATFHTLDTRQYRTDQPPGPKWQKPNAAMVDPHGTILGERQREWLFDGLSNSRGVWNVIAQQVMVARIDSEPGPGIEVNTDKWPGYEVDRRRLLRHFHDGRVANPIVITGDVHENWANELIADFDDLDSARVGVEFVGTSIASSGDGVDKPKHLDTLLSENPFVKFHNAERGYVSCELTPESWRSDYRTVAYISRRGAPLQTRASFIVESGRPVLNLV